MILFGVDITKRPMIIAEIGINHNGDVNLAKKMIEEAKKSGADVVKFQVFSPERLYVESWAKERKVVFGDEEMTLWDFIDKVKLSWDDLKALKKYAEDLGIGFLATPFSFEDADFLEEIGVQAYKIASMDLNNTPFLKYVARKEKPIILSTGMGSIGEIEEAVRAILNEGNDQIVILHCVSLYPPKPEQVHLRAIETLKRLFDFPIGFSDHTIGVHIPIAAIALGAQVIEKHFTLDKNLPGPDQKVSMTPEELKILRKAADEVWMALGRSWKVLTNEELEVARVARRSLVAKRYLKRGHILSEDDVVFKRPGNGIPPDEIRYVIGRKLKRDIPEDEIIAWEDLE